MIACLRLPDLHDEPRTLAPVLETLAGITPLVEQEEQLELRADARKRRKRKYILPRRQMDAPQMATCYLDLGKLRRDEGLEAGYHIQQTLLQAHQLPSRVSLASGKFPARTAALSMADNEIGLLAKGKEAEFLSPYPSELLPVDGETIRQLHLLGLDKLGKIAALPAPAMSERFGRQGEIMHRLASGKDTSPVQPYSPPASISVTRQFSAPVSNEVILKNALAELGDSLASRLRHVNKVTHDLVLSVRFENSTTQETRLHLRQPSASGAHIKRTAQSMLQGMLIYAGVGDVSLTAETAVPASASQLSLFDRDPVQHRQLRDVLRMLTARYGDDCFYWVSVPEPDARIPERRFTLKKASDDLTADEIP